jgi:hypothetical protein
VKLTKADQVADDVCLTYLLQTDQMIAAMTTTAAMAIQFWRVTLNTSCF